MKMRKYEVHALVEVWCEDGTAEQEVRDAASEADELRNIFQNQGRVVATDEYEEEDD